MKAQAIKKKITEIFRRYISSSSEKEIDALKFPLTAGKIYEAYVIGLIAQKLKTEEGYDLHLVNSNYLHLKSSPGPINRRFPRIELRKSGRCIAEMWTDIEFTSLSYFHNIREYFRYPEAGEYHELDIVIADMGIDGRPPHSSIWLGVECKNTEYNKSLLKEILGIRRELSLLYEMQKTRFSNWPCKEIPANPASCLLAYSTDKNILKYSRPGETFGIQFFHEELPI